MPSTVGVRIKVGRYKGRWGFADQWYWGDQTLNLVARAEKYCIRVADATTAIQFVVKDNAVMSLNRRAKARGRKLLFRSTPVKISPMAYKGMWGIHGVDAAPYPKNVGAQEVHLLRGIEYWFLVGYDGRFKFKVRKRGSIKLEGQPPWARVKNDNELRLRTNPIHVKTEEYTGYWAVAYADPAGHPYPRNEGPTDKPLYLVRGLSYTFMCGWEGRFHFKVGADKPGVEVSNPSAATSSGNVLTLKYSKIEIDPDTFLGKWGVRDINAKPYPKETVKRTLVVVPGLRYQMMVGWDGRFSFDVCHDGSVSVDGKCGNSNGKGLTLNTVQVRVTPDTQEKWAIHDVSPYGLKEGSQEFPLVPNVPFRIKTETGQALFIAHHSQAGEFHFDPPNVKIGDTNFSFAKV